MAKQVKERFTFTQIGKLFEDMSKTTPIIIEKIERPRDFISTGSYILNAALSASLFGGVSTNRITAIAGESGAGKSFICYGIAREAQKKEYCVIYIDTEFSIEKTDLKNFGIDISDEKLLLIRSNKVEDVNIIMTGVLDKLKEEKKAGKEIQKFIVFIDSVGMMSSNQEKENLIAGKIKADMATRAKALASFFRSINNDISYLGIPLVATNHIYLTMDMFPQAKQKGGDALTYAASSIVFLTKSKLKESDMDEKDLQSGIHVTAKTQKNRLAKPKKIEFDIDFEKGLNPYKGLEWFCDDRIFHLTGIGNGKWEEFKVPVIDKETGEEIYGKFIPGGNKWYVKHLNKSISLKQLFRKEVFTENVLKKLEPIINDYFKYKSIEEAEVAEMEFENKVVEISENESNEDDLFS